MVIYSERSPSACLASCPLWTSIPRHIHPPYTPHPHTHTHTHMHTRPCMHIATLYRGFLTNPCTGSGGTQRPLRPEDVNGVHAAGSTPPELLSLPARWRRNGYNARAGMLRRENQTLCYSAFFWSQSRLFLHLKVQIGLSVWKQQPIKPIKVQLSVFYKTLKKIFYFSITGLDLCMEIIPLSKRQYTTKQVQ